MERVHGKMNSELVTELINELNHIGTFFDRFGNAFRGECACPFCEVWCGRIREAIRESLPIMRQRMYQFLRMSLSDKHAQSLVESYCLAFGFKLDKKKLLSTFCSEGGSGDDDVYTKFIVTVVFNSFQYFIEEKVLKEYKPTEKGKSTSQSADSNGNDVSGENNTSSYTHAEQLEMILEVVHNGASFFNQITRTIGLPIKIATGGSIDILKFKDDMKKYVELASTIQQQNPLLSKFDEGQFETDGTNLSQKSSILISSLFNINDCLHWFCDENKRREQEQEQAQEQVQVQKQDKKRKIEECEQQEQQLEEEEPGQPSKIIRRLSKKK